MMGEELVTKVANTDRELYREKSELPADPDDYYAPSLHVTAQGGIGINVGGHVVVKTLREWHALAAADTHLREDNARMDAALRLGRDALQRMMDAWLDYHDAHSLTQPVTGASANAFEDALTARDTIDDALTQSSREG